MSLSKFKSISVGKNSVIITAVDTINPEDLEEYMGPKIVGKDFPANSRIFLIGGVEHGKDPPGRTDFTILQQMYYQTFAKLMELKNMHGLKRRFSERLSMKRNNDICVWDEMKYKLELIPVTTSETFNRSTFKVDCKFSDLSVNVLVELAKELKHQKSFVVLFAFSNSENSGVTKQFLKDLKTILKGRKEHPGIEVFNFHLKKHYFLRKIELCIYQL